MSRRAVIYFVEEPADRWFRGDHKIRRPIRRLLRGADPVGGIKTVFINLCRGLDKIGAEYVTNIPFTAIEPGDLVGMIGLGPNCLNGYKQVNRILAGVAVAEHPVQWPTLFDDYPVAKYLVHSEWVRQMYQRHYGPRIATWAVGIDTELWSPELKTKKSIDFLVYDKIMWNHDRVHRALVDPILQQLTKSNLTFECIRYGSYQSKDFKAALSRSRGMLFLCEHETQGLAYQEAMSCDVPILAWDPGQWLDPWRFHYSEEFVPATSVPFFDARCGLSFSRLSEFEDVLNRFVHRLDEATFKPREYVLENLTLEGCAKHYLELLTRYCS